MQAEALFLSALPVIDDVTERVCRRHRLNTAEADDFRSEVRLHFLQEDCAALRRFQGRSTLATYVNVVIQRVYLDHRNRVWGRWRPSADAKRLGPAAVLFERLVVRDGWSAEQAIELLRVNHGIEALETIAPVIDRLGRRVPARRTVPEDEAGQIESTGPRPDAGLLRAEHDFLAKRIRAALAHARAALPPEDALVLKMRFDDAMSVADIARALHLNQKHLYRRLEQLLARLCAALEAQGISRADIGPLLAGR